MGNLVVWIPVSEIVDGDEIVVPLTMPPTAIRVWKVEEDTQDNLVLLSLMEGERTWRQALPKTNLVPVLR